MGSCCCAPSTRRVHKPTIANTVINFEDDRLPYHVVDGSVRMVNFSLDPLALETLALTRAELVKIAGPAIGLLPDRQLVMAHCTDDILLRVVRGCIGKVPRSGDFKRFVAEGSDNSAHVAAVAEALWAIARWRSRADVNASTLLTRSLFDAPAFHRLWPVSLFGKDRFGHLVWCESLSQVQASELFARFSLSQILLLRAQISELMQHEAQKEGVRKGALLSKHVHIIDVSATTVIKFRQFATQLRPVVKLLGDQYPGTLHALFIVNAPRSALCFRNLAHML